MADLPQVNVVERILSPDTYKKYAIYVGITIIAVLLVVGGISLWRWIFPKPEKQTTSQKVTITPLSFSKVEKGGVTQTSTQIQLNEKNWEVGLGGVS